ncbi:MAG TPA: hypothetical protein VMS30_02260 [Phycisphaerales bacterium]|nr:hypothetical protein [Phycisphaerales bacterium]
MSAAAVAPLPVHSRPWQRVVIAASIALLLAMMVLRYLGPSDLYDQTQPKTISYTTDIIVHGGTHWILPVERGELPATKPPLYNWLAVPAVKWLGFNSEIGHKLPSTAAMLACWLIIVRLGRRLGREHDGDESLGWIAGLILISSYAIFKLGYLVRPDMLLTLWLLIAWVCATAAFMRQRVSGTANAVFWLAITLAGLTKGPAVLVMMVYIILAARVIGGRWSAIRLLHPIPGGLIALLVFAAWVFAVWKINPEHLKQELWFNELYGRFTGAGAEGTHGRSRFWLSEVHYQSFYFTTRFVPWSFVAAVGAIALWWRRRTRGDAPQSTLERWMWASLLFVLIVVGLFSFSVGKRADYVAVAYPQTALLAAWWLLYAWPRIGLRWPWLTPLAAALNLASISIYDHKQIWAPIPGFGDAIKAFVDDATKAMADEPLPILNCSAGQSHLQAVLGIAEDDQRRQIPDMIAGGRRFWVLAGRTQKEPYEFDLWLQQRGLRATAAEVVRSGELPRSHGWPAQVTLWRVTPDADVR